MKMSIARALKERKRIIGEMNTLWNRINQNNVVIKNIKAVDGKFTVPSKTEMARERKLDPRKLMEAWMSLQKKLIVLKTLLHSANTGAAEKLAHLSELKSELKLVECMSEYSDTVDYCSNDIARAIDVEYDVNWKTDVVDSLRMKINDLQDEIDEYNATHFIEID